MARGYGERKNYSGNTVAWSGVGEVDAEKVLDKIADSREKVEESDFQAYAEKIAKLGRLSSAYIHCLPYEPSDTKFQLVNEIKNLRKEIYDMTETLFDMSAQIDFQRFHNEKVPKKSDLLS